MHKEFTETSVRRQKKLEAAEDANTSEDEEGLFECPEANCNYIFSTFSDLEMHINLRQHSRYVNSKSVYDTLKREWANKYSTVTTSVQKAATIQKFTLQLHSGESDLQMGWALSKRRTGGVHFSTNVRQYLVAKVNNGQKQEKIVTKHKWKQT